MFLLSEVLWFCCFSLKTYRRNRHRRDKASPSDFVNRSTFSTNFQFFITFVLAFAYIDPKLLIKLTLRFPTRLQSHHCVILLNYHIEFLLKFDYLLIIFLRSTLFSLSRRVLFFCKSVGFVQKLLKLAIHLIFLNLPIVRTRHIFYHDFFIPMTIHNLFGYKLLLLFSQNCHYFPHYQFDEIWIILKHSVIQKWLLLFLLKLFL